MLPFELFPETVMLSIAGQSRRLRDVAVREERAWIRKNRNELGLEWTALEKLVVALESLLAPHSLILRMILSIHSAILLKPIHKQANWYSYAPQSRLMILDC